MLEHPLVLLLATFILTSFIGYTLSLLFLNIDSLRRVLIGPIIGYSIISLLAAYTNYMGFGLSTVSKLLLGCLLAISTVILYIKRAHFKETSIPLKFLFTIFLCGLINAGIILAPTILANAPNLFNDNTVYISISEYVREHSYTTLAEPNIEVWQQYTWENQINHFRMGSKFFVAFFASAFDLPHTLSIYPSILGLLGILIINAVSVLYLSIRKKTEKVLAELSLVLFFSLIAINFNSNIIAQGFLCQSLGVILLITLCALLYKGFNTKKDTITIAVLFAALVLTYHEITIFYGLVALFYILHEFLYKKNRNKETYLYFFVAHLLALILSPIFTKELVLGIMSSYQLNGVGWHVSDSFITYIQSIFGQNISKFSSHKIFLPGTIIPGFYLYLVFRKGYYFREKNIMKFLTIVSLPFIIGISFYYFFKLDPFTQKVGHTWNIFKITNWSYWIIPIVTGLAAYSFFKESTRNKIITITTIVCLLPAVATNIHANYSNSQYGMHIFTNNYKNPLEDFKEIISVGRNYAPANLITYNSHPNYAYLVLSLLKDESTGDLDISGKKYTPAPNNNFYPWVNYRKEHANTQVPLKTIAGFIIYPNQSATVYLDTGFSEKETSGANHHAWLTANSGTIKVLIPSGKKAQFTTLINNWESSSTNFNISLNNQVVITSSVDSSPIHFTSPILEEGLHELVVQYEGNLRPTDANDARTLALLFREIEIKEVK